VRTRAVLDVTWEELLAHPEVSERCELGSSIGILAFHGGLEMATAELAEAVAHSSGASLYVALQPASLCWHVPSHRVDPKENGLLSKLLSGLSYAVALHGYGRAGHTDPVLLGGTNREMARVLADHLRQGVPGAEVVDSLDLIPPALRGTHPLNPVNRTLSGGVQVEIPLHLRRHRFFELHQALASFACAWSPGLIKRA